MGSQPPPLTPLEQDALREIMNISFGRTAGSLSELCGVYVTLNVPFIDVLHFDDLHSTINEDIASSTPEMSMIRQFFSGRFEGSSILVFPRGEGRKILKLFDEGAGTTTSNPGELAALEEEALIEISNIIKGACVSSTAELLGDVVSYSPPRHYTGDQIQGALEESFAGKDCFGIVFKTVFDFEEFDASGFLFLISNCASLEWLRNAIGGYLSEHA